MLVDIENIKVNERHRKTEPGHVQELAESILGIGLLNPITVDKHFALIAGLHRLEAVKSLGWRKIECTVCDLKGLEAELAEIDENYVRFNLSTIEYGELLLRRKEIYEILHPETRATYEGGEFKGNQYQKVVAAESAATTKAKSFTQDASEKLGLAPRTVRAQMQAARNLTPEAKSIIKGSEVKVTKENALKLSRLIPEEQIKAAALLTSGAIQSVDEYADPASQKTSQKVVAEESAATTFPNEPKQNQQRGNKESAGAAPDSGSSNNKAETTDSGAISAETGSNRKRVQQRTPSTVQEIIADLKDHNKDASATPEMFLASITSFAARTEEEIAWYGQEYYHPVFPHLSSAQMSRLHDVVRRIGAAAENIYSQVKIIRKKGICE